MGGVGEVGGGRVVVVDLLGGDGGELDGSVGGLGEVCAAREVGK